MQQAIYTWEDYRTTVREYEAVLEHAKAVSSAVLAEPAAAKHARYGEQIFLKLLSHCMALHTLAADGNRRGGRALWDVPTMSAAARCVVETHDAFEYIAGHDVPAPEREFRIQLWELHDRARQLKLTGDGSAAVSQQDALRADLRKRQLALEGHDFFAALPLELRAELRRRMVAGDPPAFHINQRQRCALSGVDADWHNAVSVELSQYVHTLPFAVERLFQLPPASPEAVRLMAMPLQAALPLLVRVTQATVRLVPGSTPEPPSRTARTMAAWRALAEGAQHSTP
ncbi:hypothetical protein [Pelomonas cellulosilytica]|uniref:Uncharacterized protein n=1 Tax=Pelomonas cellulosilytica TaxID=2906762 RepID=A0ABS8XJD6_9BURK|nr:hypothetical protein [Pelomonas sp. P8]MCE4552971.1 hypothetical protein [Pelomonas sp. P8]